MDKRTRNNNNMDFFVKKGRRIQRAFSSEEGGERVQVSETDAMDAFVDVDVDMIEEGYRADRVDPFLK